MNTLSLVIMGKTGAGKSTLLNAVMQEEAAPTGTGQAVTKENKVYSKKLLLPIGQKRVDGGYGMVGMDVKLYDTVGLEIDRTITQNTLNETQDYLKKIQRSENGSDIALVWFCVSSMCNRFEAFEVDLIRELSITYEIPFVIVITKCHDNEKGELEKQIREYLPDVLVVRVLAKDFKTRGGIISSFGILELLRLSVVDYNKHKVKILESKLNQLAQEKNERIEELRKNGMEYIQKYTDRAMKIGYIPLGCIPIVHGICIKMLVELNKMVGINSARGFATDIFAEVIMGIIMTPFMSIPVVSALAAGGYVSAIGETYLDSLISVIQRSSDSELKNNELMSKRIAEELKKRKIVYGGTK